MADTTTAPRTMYGIVHTPTAFETIEHANAAVQIPLVTAIYRLQSNPRPDDREPADEYLAGASTIIVRTTDPPYLITYHVDDTAQRVLILAVSAARWKQ